MASCTIINDTVNLIKEQIGLDVTLCDYFTGLIEKPIGQYFNIVLNEKTSESRDYIKLERLANKGILLRIEPNGTHRVAIFPKTNIKPK